MSSSGDAIKSESERDYVLGTHDAEMERLGLQHRVWRSRALSAWTRAGFNSGQTILDIGCGPGYATIDLAEIVGPMGRVLAVDRSRRFLDALQRMLQARHLGNVDLREQDLDTPNLVDVAADGAWARWVFSFVTRPRDLLAHVTRVLKPGGTLVLHEYCDYRTWRLLPRSSEHEEFVERVMASWRAAGGEPDIALSLPSWLTELGFEIREVNPLVDVVPPSSFVWQWPRAFIEVGLKRLVDLGHFDAAQADATWRSFCDRESKPNSLLMTPTVLEIVAVRR